MQQKLITRCPLIILMMLTIFSSCKKDHSDQPGDIRPITAASSKYVTELFQYLPAPGQFINTSSGDSTGARSVLGNQQGLVSLGAWGGTIVFGFDHTVLNRKDTADIMIYGNALNTYAEPGVVWVMKDVNGNGLPDDTWYELKGSEFNKPGYVRNYSVTYTKPDSTGEDIRWRDNKGKSGIVARVAFHNQPNYPAWANDDEYTLYGTLLPSSNIDSSNQQFVTSASFSFGYADNTQGGDMVDIANAIDGDGNNIELNGIDFIKIQTGIQFNLGWVGELSTDITGIADISMGLN